MGEQHALRSGAGQGTVTMNAAPGPPAAWCPAERADQSRRGEAGTGKATSVSGRSPRVRYVALGLLLAIASFATAPYAALASEASVRETQAKATHCSVVVARQYAVSSPSASVSDIAEASYKKCALLWTMALNEQIKDDDLTQSLPQQQGTRSGIYERADKAMLARLVDTEIFDARVKVKLGKLVVPDGSSDPVTATWGGP